MTDDFEPPEYERQDRKVDEVWPELKRLTDAVRTREELMKDELVDTFSYPVSHKLLRYFLAVNRKYCDIERRGGNPDVLYEA